ncbi:RNase H domain-containing protein [Trichonephila clavipes]|nr:RNase H domain-containing protein [Trichonephila clavipes]
MKILPDGSGSYVEYRHCPGTQLDPKHPFSCPFIVGALFKIDNDCSMDILYSDRPWMLPLQGFTPLGIFDYILMFYYYNFCTLSYMTTTADQKGSFFSSFLLKETATKIHYKKLKTPYPKMG